MSAPTPAVKTCSRCKATGHISTWKSCPETLRLEALGRAEAIARQQREQAEEKAVKDAESQRKVALALKAEFGFVMDKVRTLHEAKRIVGTADVIKDIIADTDKQIAELDTQRAYWESKRNEIIDGRRDESYKMEREHRREREALRQKHTDIEDAYREATDRLVLEVYSEDDLKQWSAKVKRLKEEREHLLAFTMRTVKRNAFIAPLVGIKGQKTLMNRLEDSFIAEGETCPITCEALVKGDIHITECGHAYSKAGWASMSAYSRECGVCKHSPDLDKMRKLNTATGSGTTYERGRRTDPLLTLQEREARAEFRAQYEAEFPDDA